MDSVPTTMKKKARLLTSMLQDHPNLSWDEDGTVKFTVNPFQVQILSIWSMMF